ncbi:MAG TPA: endonuclease III [Acidisarcina sp.]
MPKLIKPVAPLLEPRSHSAPSASEATPRRQQAGKAPQNTAKRAASRTAGSIAKAAGATAKAVPPGRVSQRPAPSKKPLPSRSKRSPRPDPLKPARIEAILRELAAAYPDAECALVHRTPWELLVATILSAQTTDVRVNMVTPRLFEVFPTPAAFVEASLPVVEEIIRPTGFFRTKAKSVTGAARRLVEEFGGEVPRTMEELLTVPGAARKTSNVVLGVAFGIAVGVVVDTHVLRLSRRLQLTTNDDPKKVEVDLMAILPQERWIAFSHEIIQHGRRICVARRPRCVDCTLERLCNSPDKTWASH